MRFSKIGFLDYKEVCMGLDWKYIRYIECKIYEYMCVYFYCYSVGFKIYLILYKKLIFIIISL